MTKTKNEFKAGIKKMMKNYNFTLDQAIFSMHKMNPEYTIVINQADFELQTEQITGRL